MLTKRKRKTNTNKQNTIKRVLDKVKALTAIEIDRIIEMAWEDRTPFDAIEAQFQLNESNVIKLMRASMRASSFRLWRKRVQGRNTKHAMKRNFPLGRHKCNRQRSISMNKVSKR